MGTIGDCLSDSTFLENAFSYLESCHGVRSVIVDPDGSLHPLNARDIREYPEKRSYPVPCERNIGRIRFSAETAGALAKAEPHIRFCLDGLQILIEKEQVLQQTMEEMLRLSDQLHFLFALGNKVKGVHDLHRYCKLVLKEVSEAVDADSAFVQILRKGDKQQVVLYKLAGEELEKISGDLPPESTEDRTVVLSCKEGASALVTPIKEKDGTIGRAAFIKNPGKRPFTSYHKQLASIVNSIACPTMESLALYHNMHVLYLNTVKALAAAIDAKDAYTHGHSFRVAKYSIAIGKHLEISSDNLSDLEIAAYMHDLGKIGIPEGILGKPGRLSAKEFEEIKKHPVLTNKILEPIELPQSIVDATLQHHERLDGRGYPFGLKGESITLFARIIAVADVFDALTSARPYRNAMTVEDALTELCEGIDTEYDRNVVHAFITALRHKSEHRGLAEVYSGLRFMQLDKMNQFLESLTGHLIGVPV
jgi:HD-GYP domain-containing protein (c-di-GMP phosphodiesterase class II)